MNAVEIEEAISALAELPSDGGAFPFAFLEAFGKANYALFDRKGRALADLQAGFRKHLAPGDLPFTLAAEIDGAFAGMVSLIACDEPERSDLAPWLAALWVAPEHRKSGLGAALVTEIEQRAAVLGIARIYLSARSAIAPFYEKRGWRAIDHDIGPAKLVIMERVILEGVIPA
mgnify:CR=1 FL=1